MLKTNCPFVSFRQNFFSLIPAREMRFWGPGVEQRKWSIPRSMMRPCDETYFSTLVTRKFGNTRIPTSIVTLPCSAQEKFHVFVDVVVALIDRRTDLFCCFAPSPKIAFLFGVSCALKIRLSLLLERCENGGFLPSLAGGTKVIFHPTGRLEISWKCECESTERLKAVFWFLWEFYDWRKVMGLCTRMSRVSPAIFTTAATHITCFYYSHLSFSVIVSLKCSVLFVVEFESPRGLSHGYPRVIFKWGFPWGFFLKGCYENIVSWNEKGASAPLSGLKFILDLLGRMVFQFNFNSDWLFSWELILNV